MFWENLLISINIRIFVSEIEVTLNNTIMALEIKAIPTLHGDAAERFLKLIDVSSEERKKRGGIKRDPQMVKKVLQKAGLR